MTSQIQTGRTSVSGSVQVALAQASPLYLKLGTGTSPVVGTENTSNWAFVPAQGTPAMTSFLLKNVEQKGRYVFGAATTLLAKSIYSVIHNVYTAAGLTWTVQFYKVATSGTKTQIGSDLTIVSTTADQTFVTALDNAEVSFLAGEAIQLEIINTYTGASLTCGEGTGMVFQGS